MRISILLPDRVHMSSSHISESESDPRWVGEKGHDDHGRGQISKKGNFSMVVSMTKSKDIMKEKGHE